MPFTLVSYLVIETTFAYATQLADGQIFFIERRGREKDLLIDKVI